MKGTNNSEPARVSTTEVEANDLIEFQKSDIKIDRSLSRRDFAKTLAHEFGHAAYTKPNAAKVFTSKVKTDPDLKGHDKGNPTGEAADKAESDFEKIYKLIRKKLKIY